MSDQSIAGIVGIIILCVLMLIFSFLFNERGESNVSLLLLFAGLALAFILVFKVLSSENNKNK